MVVKMASLRALWQVVLLCMLNLTLGFNHMANQSAKDLLQDIVTWDEFSIMVRGERVLFLSGEFHPFRLPSPGLWLDVFQKIKAVGFSGVSFYTNWALLEGKPGEFRADGVFALEQFFDAATEAGIYLLARPGPYINSEVSGGGYPGWTSRIKGPVRSNATDWLDATRNYINNMGAIISKAQITNGGPIVLFQPENEYTICAEALAGAGLDSIGEMSKCLNHYYMADVEAMWREAGIVLPYLINDALPIGNFVPGSGVGAGDIYGFDGYPLGWGEACESTTRWPLFSKILTSCLLRRFGSFELEQGKRGLAYADHQLHNPYADESQHTILNCRVSGRHSRAMVRVSTFHAFKGR